VAEAVRQAWPGFLVAVVQGEPVAWHHVVVEAVLVVLGAVLVGLGVRVVQVGLEEQAYQRVRAAGEEAVLEVLEVLEATEVQVDCRLALGASRVLHRAVDRGELAGLRVLGRVGGFHSLSPASIASSTH